MLPHKFADDGTGRPPRQIEVQRKKKLYAAQDIARLIEERGVRHCADDDKEEEKNGIQLPLHLFDDEAYEVRQPSEWLALGKLSSDDTVAKLPAKVRKGPAWIDSVVEAYDADTQRWTARPIISQTELGEEMFVHRLNVLFAAEDPWNFADRVAAAHSARQIALVSIAYNLCVDCMPTADLGPLDAEMASRLLARAVGGSSSDDRDASSLLAEVEMCFMRSMNKLALDKSIKSGEPLVAHLSGGVSTSAPASQSASPPPRSLPATIDFSDAFDQFSFASLLTERGVINALQKTAEENGKVLALPLLNTKVMKSVKLEEFEHLQTTCITSAAETMKGQWTKEVKNHVRASFKHVKKGWYNLRETSSEVYDFSKLKRFFVLLRCKMQDAVRDVVISALERYLEFIEGASCARVAIKSSVDVEETVPSGRPVPLFAVDVDVAGEADADNNGGDEHGGEAERHQNKQRREEADNKESSSADDNPDDGEENGSESGAAEGELQKASPRSKIRFTYCTDPQRFVDAPIAAVNQALEALHSITQVERLVMDKLFWPHTPLLRSVRPYEDWVCELVASIRGHLSAAIEPLHEYIATFDEHLAFEAFCARVPRSSARRVRRRGER